MNILNPKFLQKSEFILKKQDPFNANRTIDDYNEFSHVAYILGYYGFLIFTALTLLLGSWFVIPSGKVGLVSKLGVFDKDTREPGVHFKLPLIHSVTKVDVRSKTAHYGYESSDKAESKTGIIQLPKITVLDEKNLNIGLELSLRYKVNPDTVYSIFINDGSNFFNKRINPVVLEVSRNVLGSYTADQVSTKRQEISNELKVALDLAFEKETFFFIEEVNIRRFTLDEIIRNKIKAVEEANQKEKQLKYEVLQAEQRRQIAVKQAQAKSASILEVAKSQAKANRLINSSLSSNLIKYKQMEKWDGKLPVYSGVENGGILISPK